MAINVVENVHGKARVKWLGASVLFVGLWAACGLIPAIAMWLVFDDPKMVATTLAVGFSMACCSLPMLIVQQLRLPIERLSIRK